MTGSKPRSSALASRLWAMHHHLVEVHVMYRQQLAALRRALADWADEGSDPERVTAAARRLSPGITGRDLRVHCLSFCQAMTVHHSIEDGQIFPDLRELGPHAGPTIDRLESDHRQIVPLLSDLARAADQLTNDPASAPAAIAALHTLAERLTAHLDYEEASLAALVEASTS